MMESWVGLACFAALAVMVIGGMVVDVLLGGRDDPPPL